jgi:hypothetical protein
MRAANKHWRHDGDFLMSRYSFLGLTIAFLTGSFAIGDEPARPPRPERYNARVRYQIDAFRNERLMQFNEMVRYFEKLGFVKEAGEEDEPENPKINRMNGTIAAKDARRLLGERHVKTILLYPEGTTLPKDPKALVRVQFQLVPGLPKDREQALSDRVLSSLKELGFQEAVGYDHRGFTRLEGLFPSGKLDALLDNPVKPLSADRESPFATRPPIQIVEVESGLPLSIPRPSAPAIPKGQEKITPELRSLIGKQDVAGKPLRLEVILSAVPDFDDRGWKSQLQDAAPGLVIEGRLGPIVSVLARPNQALALASLPGVDTVRLPRSGESKLSNVTEVGEASQKLLEATGLERLHKLGHKGRGMRLAVVDGDFRGWDQQLGKGLPKSTKYIDLTAARNPNVLPDPFPEGPTGTLGTGTLAAMAAILAAPETDLTLIRVDPKAPYQLYNVARYINGDTVRSENLEHRSDDLIAEAKSLEARQQELLLERQRVIDMFSGDEESKKLRDEFLKKEAKLDADEKTHKEAEIRLLALSRALTGLKGIKIVACPLVWREGHPIVGSGPLGRYMDDRPFKAALWLQAAGEAKGRVWEGTYLDTDGNGVMEFASTSVKLPAGRWTNELNFLGWQASQGSVKPELPAKTRLCISIQWREPHDPSFWKNKEDLYRQPIASPQLVILRQLDPTGTKAPADDLAVVAQSVGLPQRIDNQPNSAVYEQTVEFDVPQDGRYALRVELKGGVPNTIRPAGEPTLPKFNKSWELRPRIFVETLQGAGRAVFLDYATAGASPGMPGSAQTAITVESADKQVAADKKSQRDNLYVKPDLLSFHPFGGGADLAESSDGPVVGFAAGWAATARSAGAPAINFQQSLGIPPGESLGIPADWTPGTAK